MPYVRRLGYPLLIGFICFFGAAHLWHLRADFPHHSPWQDWAKYTDEGWYGNAAIRAHLFGSWYLPGDFNLVSAVPVWPTLEWTVFGFTGVSLEAARCLAGVCFLLDVLLSYALVRARGPRWAGLLVVAILVSNPFLYCFSRLAILEPLLIMLTLAAMNLAIRLPGFARRELISAVIGLLFAGMVLTKTSAVFLLPALLSIIVVPFWHEKRRLVRLLVAAGATTGVALACWFLVVVGTGLYGDFKYFFSVNDYPKPSGLSGEFTSLWSACRGITQPDRILIILPALMFLAAVISRIRTRGHRPHWVDGLWHDPLFLGSFFAIAGYIGFMTYQNHSQPRYYVVIAFFSFSLLAQMTARLLQQTTSNRFLDTRKIGQAVLGTVLIAITVNSIRTLKYVLHPEYTWVTAAQDLTRYMDQHPNGNRLLLAGSGDEISLITHVPSICDIWGTDKLSDKLARYRPGWYATWDRLDPRILREIHPGFSIEQVAAFPAFEDPGHSMLYLFKLHPRPEGGLQPGDFPAPLPGDKINIPVI